jgi:hypothetical protein
MCQSLRLQFYIFLYIFGISWPVLIRRRSSAFWHRVGLLVNTDVSQQPVTSIVRVAAEIHLKLPLAFQLIKLSGIMVYLVRDTCWQVLLWGTYDRWNCLQTRIQRLFFYPGEDNRNVYFELIHIVCRNKSVTLGLGPGKIRGACLLGNEKNRPSYS